MGFQDWLHGQGVDVHGKSVTEALNAANLNWEVKTSDFRYGLDDSGTTTYQHREKTKQVAYRGDNGMFIDIYHERVPYQNRDIVEMFKGYLEAADLELGWLATLKDGKELLAGAVIPRHSEMGNDRTDHYLLLRDSHVNGNGLKISLYSNRTICTNGMNIVVQNSVVPHTQEISQRKEFMASTTDSVLQAISEREAMHEQLTQVEMSKEEATMQLIAAFGNPGESVDDQPRVVQTALKLFNGQGKGSESLTAYNTAYGLLQSVTEYYNWHAPRSQAKTALQSLLDGSRAKAMGTFERQLQSVCLTA